jgi:hypothetical protein
LCSYSIARTRSQQYRYEIGCRDGETPGKFCRDDGPIVKSLAALRWEENHCKRCPFYKKATQAVPGEGPKSASMMLVGEQPGHQEDRVGRPFLGPAGRLLDQALTDAGIARNQEFMTNVVKHFKHKMCGKHRLHKRPNPTRSTTAAGGRILANDTPVGNLRIDDRADKERAYGNFVADLKRAAKAVP